MMLLLFVKQGETEKPFVRFSLTPEGVAAVEREFVSNLDDPENLEDGGKLIRSATFQPDSRREYVHLLFRILIIAGEANSEGYLLQHFCLALMRERLEPDQEPFAQVVAMLPVELQAIINQWFELSRQEVWSLCHELRQFGQAQGL